MKYIDIAKEKIKKLKNKDDIIILAIESSCDETAVAITKGKRILSNKISSQIEIHARFGGVVPEIASRNHILAIDNILEQALEESKMTLKDIDAVAVTYGAGLLGALLVGVAYAKSLALSLGVPLIGINHIKGHIFANFISHQELKYPFICLVASGGHTALLKVEGYQKIESLGSTCDDAAGEAFDKVARVLGLGYPGGPEVEKAAQKGKDKIILPRPFKGEEHLNFSYSGLKTAVVNYVHNTKKGGGDVNIYDVAKSFQNQAVGMLIDNAIKAAKRHNIKSIAVAGGVGANTALREGLEKAAKEHGIKLFLPPKSLCTDNAAMIAIAAYFAIKENISPADLDLDADASLDLIS
ncbi:MAG: tRNA (adenosine(37)-N6)-threonylcarbamoyltransferase complex transferase subunit TsaD [Bacillota bacterium]|jgi:N6-L-threonylcarbamoyladenine synthase|nr:tRNA (adenosine(37)-N6)-threonylcarbamoyltransferase complex transferase subunit TsaD [Bacillota bacterium]